MDPHNILETGVVLHHLRHDQWQLVLDKSAESVPAGLRYALAALYHQKNCQSQLVLHAGAEPAFAVRWDMDVVQYHQ
jgi:hypothetical protein